MDITDTYTGPTLQLPNNSTISATQTGHIQLSNSIVIQSTKAHLFEGLHSASLISLVQLCDDVCIAILDNSGINILKDPKLVLIGRQNKLYGLWYIPI